MPRHVRHVEPVIVAAPEQPGGKTGLAVLQPTTTVNKDDSRIPSRIIKLPAKQVWNIPTNAEPYRRAVLVHGCNAQAVVFHVTTDRKQAYPMFHAG